MPEVVHSSVDVASMYVAGSKAVLLEITILVTSLPNPKWSRILPGEFFARIEVAVNPPSGGVGGWGVQPPPPTATHVAPAPDPDNVYPALQLAAPHVGKELKEAELDTALHKLVHCVVADGDTVYVPAVVGSVANDVPGVEFSEQTKVVPLWLTWIDFTVLSDDPT